MTTTLIILTLLFIVVSVALVLIVLVQRPQGGGLAGAFGGAGGGGTDTAFGGRTGDVLTIATVSAFLVYLLLGVALNIIDNEDFGNQANEAQAAVEGDGEVLEQDTAGEFLVPETAPEVPASTPADAAPAAPATAAPAAATPAPAAPAPAAPAATGATTEPAETPSGDG